MNSEPSRLPSVHESKSRLGSAAARRKWNLDKPENSRDIASRILTEKTVAKLVAYANAK